jgi:hypothetical protein
MIHDVNYRTHLARTQTLEENAPVSEIYEIKVLTFLVVWDETPDGSAISMALSETMAMA